MQIEYHGEHSITFYDYRNADTASANSVDIPVYDTWGTWHLIPTTPPYVKPYQPRIKLVDIPGSNGVIDLSESVNDKVYHDRVTGEWQFIMDTERAGKSATELYYDIRSGISGKWLVVLLRDLPIDSDGNKYRIYTGRITISDFNIGSQYAQITLSYNLGAKNTVYLATSKIGDNNAEEAWLIREQIGDGWMPTTYDENGEMTSQTFTPIGDDTYWGDQFDIEYVAPDGPMYEIIVDDDGTLIQEDLITMDIDESSISEEDAVIDHSESYNTPSITYYNDDGTALLTHTFDADTTINPYTYYTNGIPISPLDNNALFNGWYSGEYDKILATDENLLINHETVLYADYSYSGSSETVWYNVKLYNDDGSLIFNGKVEEGVILDNEYHSILGSYMVSNIYGRNGAVFDHWDNNNVYNVQEDFESKAVYRRIVTVGFMDDVSSTYWHTSVINYGDTASCPSSKIPSSKFAEVYYDSITAEFTGWDKPLTNLRPPARMLNSEGIYEVRAVYEYTGEMTFKFNVCKVASLIGRILNLIQEITIRPFDKLDLTNTYRLTTLRNHITDSLATSFKGWITGTNSTIYTKDDIDSLYPLYEEINGPVGAEAIFDYDGCIENSWAEIFAAEEDGTYRTKYHIGDRMLIWSYKQYVPSLCMQIIAFDTDELFEESGNAKITWMSEFTYDSINMLSPEADIDEGWGDSRLRNYLNNTLIYNLLPQEIIEHVKTVKKTYYDAKTETTKISNDKLWIPSFREMMYSDYYPTWNTLDNRKIKKEDSGPVYFTGVYGRDASVGQINKPTYVGNPQSPIDYPSYWLRTNAYILGEYERYRYLTIDRIRSALTEAPTYKRPTSSQRFVICFCT